MERGEEEPTPEEEREYHYVITFNISALGVAGKVNVGWYTDEELIKATSQPGWYNTVTYLGESRIRKTK